MKLKKILLTTILFSTLLCLFCGMHVLAEKVGEEIKDSDGNTYFVWEVDTETETLTITGKGTLHRTPREYEGTLWASYAGQIHYVVLEGFSSADWGWESEFRDGFDLKKASGHFNGYSWQLDLTTGCLFIDGSGEGQGTPWQTLPCKIKEATLGDEVEEYGSICPSMHIGKNYRATDGWGYETITIDPENPYLSVYNNCVYTKDFSKLLYSPASQKELNFHPKMKIIGAQSIYSSPYNPRNKTIVVPWGVTTIEDRAFVLSGDVINVILPDTVTSMLQTDAGGKDCSVLFTYSKSNKAVDNAINGKTDTYNRPIAKAVASLYEYYPDHISAPQTPGGPGSSGIDKPSDPSKPAESKPESSKPAESKPAESKPAASSTPTSSTPQSKPQPESAAPTESSAPAEESKPAESESTPESVSEMLSSEAVVSSEAEPSSEGSSQPDTSKDQETGGRSGATIPLTIALCAVLTAVSVLLFLLLRKKENKEHKRKKF